MKFAKIKLFGLSFFLLLLWACQPVTSETVSGFKSYDDVVRDLIASAGVKAGESVAVVGFYDGVSGDYTALGDQWRDRAETALSGTGVEVRVVRDMGLVLDVLETVDKEFTEAEVWHNSGSDYILTGHYYISKNIGSAKKNSIELHLKLLKVQNQKLVAAKLWTTWLEKGWQQKYAVIRGNIYQKAIAVVTSNADANSPRPPLKAVLDRKNPCYPAAAPISLQISSVAGAHIYILNIAADNSVTLNYPNRYLKDKGLVSSKFTFPPPEIPGMRLQVYPLPDDNPSREAFKIIASYEALDFSFLKVPDGQIYAGAAATELKKVLVALKKAPAFSEVTLPYLVGRGCE